MCLQVFVCAVVFWEGGGAESLAIFRGSLLFGLGKSLALFRGSLLIVGGH